jgi:hypothetical protein
MNTKFQNITWKEFDGLCYSLYQKIKDSNFQPDLIIGLMRGGIIPARILADYFKVDLDFYTINVKFYTDINQTLKKPIIKDFQHIDHKSKKVLVVDDIYDSGKTMKAIRNCFNNNQLFTATLHCRENNTHTPDYFADIAYSNNWIIYPWEKIEFQTQQQER